MRENTLIGQDLVHKKSAIAIGARKEKLLKVSHYVSECRFQWIQRCASNRYLLIDRMIDRTW